MLRLMATSAVLALCCAACCTPVYAACDEDCAYEAEEAAYARSSAREEAREEAEEEGYAASRRSQPVQAAQPSTKRERTERTPEMRKPSPKLSRAPVSREQAPSAPAAAPAPPASPRPGRIASENSSIAGGDMQVAADETADDNPPPARRPVGCKTYFPSVGLTVSVSCD